MRRDPYQSYDDGVERYLRSERREERQPSGKHGRRRTARERRAVDRRQVQILRRGWRAADRRRHTAADIDSDDTDESCWRCGGDGYGIVGTDWDNDDPINEDDGLIEECDCCRGSGRASDCVYW